MLGIASDFSNIEIMCSKIHDVPKYGAIEGILELKEPWVTVCDVLSMQAHQAGGQRYGGERAVLLTGI